MANQFSLAGANPGKQTKYAPLYNGRWSSGIWTNRSPLRDAATTRITEKYYGAAGDALIAGSNVEITNRLTLARRPGNSAFTSAIFSNVQAFYDFRVFDSQTEQIIVMVDQTNALYALSNINSSLPVSTLVWTKSPGAGQTFMQSVGNILFFGNGVDNKKWLQSIFNRQPNMQLNTTGGLYPYFSTYLIDKNYNIQQLTGCALLVASVTASMDLVTVYVTGYDLTKILTAGEKIEFRGGMVASFLNNQTVTIQDVGTGYFDFQFVTADYPNTNENGYSFAYVYPGDGSPITGTSTTSAFDWSTQVPTASNNFVGGISIDGTTVWTCRGNFVENWGIQPPTTALTPTIVGSYPVYKDNTYYSLPGVIIDSNGNLEEVTKSGLSGATEPTNWSTSINGLTYENGVNGITWTMIQSAASMQWQASTFFPNDYFIIETATDSTQCLYQLSAAQTPYIVDNVSAYIFPGNSAEYGVFVQSYPTSLGDAQASYTSLNGWNFTGNPQSSGALLVWDVIDNAGNTVSTVNPFPGLTQDYDMVILANVEIPTPGTYTFVNVHHDGCLFGIGGTGGDAFTIISATSDNPTGQSVTAVGGFPIVGGTNIRYESGGTATDTFVINFQNAGTYQFEFNFAYWYHTGLQMTFTCNGHVMGFGAPSSGGGYTGNLEPIWPAWTTVDAPSYPNVIESNGQLQWNNLGPIADFAWYPNTTYTLPNSTIVDGNSNQQAAYRTGHTGTTPPVFATTLNALTADPSPNLIWINQGPVVIPPSGTVTASNGGWKYAISLVNTLDDTVSNATPVSAATGNFTGAQYIQLAPGDGLQNLTIDPQADYVAIWRSTDGQSQPFLIPGPNDISLPVTIPLSQYLTEGYQDTTPDTGLNNLIEAPILGENTPPATGAVGLAYYLNRIFYNIGNTVYFTTGPDTPAGNGLNGVLPANFDEQVSLVKRQVPTTKGMIVFTVSDINLIAGGTTIPDAVPLIQGIGISSYNALDVNGSTIGFFTTDNQFIIMDPQNGVSSAGFPIGDQFRLNTGQPGQTWNPANVYVAWHVDGEDQGWFVADGQYGWYRLISTPAPETGYTWSPFATIVQGAGCVQSIEVTPGVHKLLVAPPIGGNGRILQRDLSSNTDALQPFGASAVLGSVVLAQPGQIAVVSFVTTESVNVGTPHTIGMLIDEAYPYYTGPFQVLKNWKTDPPTLLPSTSILGLRFYMDELQDYAALMRHCQVQINWAAENAANEMLTLTLFGGYIQED